MTALDANPDDTARSAATEAPAPVVGPMAGDPGMLGLGSFIVGSIALGLGLVGVVPVGVLGAPLAIILAATALGLLLAAIWAAAVGQSAVAAIFGIFGTFWLSYAVLVLGLDHNWFAITVAAVLATVKLFLVAWLVVVADADPDHAAAAVRPSPCSSRWSPSRCCSCCSPSPRRRRSACRRPAC